jgi:GTPase
LRGPGETQLEVDRREIGRKIARLKDEIEGVRAHRERHRRQRIRAGIPTVALVGYTNAGKSTLLNAVSGADVYVANQLFATLDPTTRRVKLPSGRMVLFSDTVGFIQKLPVSLVAAFRATLEEVTEADMLLHVVDASHPLLWEHVDIVEDTLAELEAGRVPKLLVLNKIDLGGPRKPVDFQALGYRDAIQVSALHQTGLDSLLAAVDHLLVGALVTINVLIPYSQGEVLSAIYELGVVVDEKHVAQGVEIEARVPPSLAGRVRQALGATSETGEETEP